MKNPVADEHGKGVRPSSMAERYEVGNSLHGNASLINANWGRLGTLTEASKHQDSQSSAEDKFASGYANKAFARIHTGHAFNVVYPVGTRYCR